MCRLKPAMNWLLQLLLAPPHCTVWLLVLYCKFHKEQKEQSDMWHNKLVKLCKQDHILTHVQWHLPYKEPLSGDWQHDSCYQAMEPFVMPILFASKEHVALFLIVCRKTRKNGLHHRAVTINWWPAEPSNLASDCIQICDSDTLIETQSFFFFWWVHTVSLLVTGHSDRLPEVAHELKWLSVKSWLTSKALKNKPDENPVQIH